MILKLELDGETFVLNKIKLINTILQKNGWTKTYSLKMRLENYAMFMQNCAKRNFMPCQRKARTKFVKFYDFSTRDNAKDTLLNIQKE